MRWRGRAVGADDHGPALREAAREVTGREAADAGDQCADAHRCGRLPGGGDLEMRLFEQGLNPIRDG